MTNKWNRFAKVRQLGMLLANVERACLLLTAIHVLLDKGAYADTFTLGYITGSKRRPGDLEYQRPGYRISGAISLAVEEVTEPLIFPRTLRDWPQLARKYLINNDTILESLYSTYRNIFLVKSRQISSRGKSFVANAWMPYRENELGIILSFLVGRKFWASSRNSRVHFERHGEIEPRGWAWI